MNKLLLSLTIAMVLGLYSCSNADEPQFRSSIAGAKVTTVQVINGEIVSSSRGSAETNALCFADEKSFEEFKAELSRKDYDEKLAETDKFGVVTIQRIADDANTELEEIGENAVSEQDFRSKYSAYVEKYKGVLYTNPNDETDLDLYVPGEKDILSFIANKDGVYVVGEEICKAPLSKELPYSFVNSVSPLATTPHVNSYTVEPQRHKKVSFSIARRAFIVHVTMECKKKMWYGWKNDDARIMMFVPNFDMNGTGLTVAKWLDTRNFRVGVSSKYKLDTDLLTLGGSGALKGKVYTWTDLTAEHDANGQVIFDVVNKIQYPRCLDSKSETVIINLGAN